MGVYVRRDSKYYWMLIERPGARALKESTKVIRDAPDAMSRKLQRQQAEEIYRARMTALARARHDLPPLTRTETTFDTFADWYTAHHIAKHRGAERERAALKQLRAFFGPHELTAITSALVHEYETQRLATVLRPATKTRPARTVQPRTVNREVAVLKSMLIAAVPVHLKASPLAGRKMLRAVKPAKRVLTPEEETRLLAELPERDRALYIVAVDTLARLSNVINLTRAEDHGRYMALVDSKTGPYTVPLSRRARKALDAVPDTGPYYFPHRRTAKHSRDARGAIRRLLERACKRAGIPYGRAIGGVTFHTATRATGATRMLRAKIDPRTVQAIGNWRDFRSMQTYLEPDAKHLHEAVNLIAPITSESQSAKKRATRQR